MRPQSLRSNPRPLAVVHDDIPVNRAGTKAPGAAFDICRDSTKEKTSRILAVSGGIKIFFQKLNCERMGRDVTELSALAVN